MNKIKYAINITLSILLIAIAALNATIHLVSVVMVINTDSFFESMIPIASAIMSVANFALAAIAIVLLVKASKRTMADIYIIICLMLLSISIVSIIMRIIERPYPYFYFEIVVYIALVALSIFSLLTKNTPDKIVEAPPAIEPQPAELTIGNKIAQIKQMCEQCLISEQDAKTAVERLIAAELNKS